MRHRPRTWVVLGLLATIGVASAGRAENPMGYRVLAAEQAASLPRNHGALGLDVERGQPIDSGGMAFELIRVKSVRRGSPAEAGGLREGDQIVAVDATVFPSLAAFAAYVGALRPGAQATVDYLPADAGPAQAQRVSLTVGGPGAQPAKSKGGLSTGAKVAIGLGALFGCYELGCFSHGSTAPTR